MSKDVADTSDATRSDATASRSDNNNENIEERWTKLLLKWLNRCVHPQNPVTKLKKKCLLHVVNIYKQDICEEPPDNDLTLDYIEPLIKYNYQLLKLSHIPEDNSKRKLYIMTSVLLFHCCVSSINGMVDSDICAHLNQIEQQMILKYCEKLADMTVTCDNVDAAVKYACEEIKPKTKKRPKIKNPTQSTAVGSGEQVPATDTSQPSCSDTNIEVSSSSTSRKRNIRFQSTVTVSPSVANSNPFLNEPRTDVVAFNSKLKKHRARNKTFDSVDTQADINGAIKKDFIVQSSSKHLCLKKCSCDVCDEDSPVTCIEFAGAFKKCGRRKIVFSWKIASIVLVALATIVIALVLIKPWAKSEVIEDSRSEKTYHRRMAEEIRTYIRDSFICTNSLCQKAYVGYSADKVYKSLSRCILQCMGPQLWPKPIGFTYYSDKLVALATNKLEYKFQTIPSEIVHSYLAHAFKLFIADLARLESIDVGSKPDNDSEELFVRKMYIQFDVELDPDPRVRLDTDETYNLKTEVINNMVTIKIVSPSFCGARHALETLSQLILLDQHSGRLITLSEFIIKDSPSYKYRGLMIDTGRNYIPIPDLIRTIDAMATCKLNTLHWRISDAASFPLLLRILPQLFEFGGYDKTLVYTKEDVQTVVKRAGIRGIRVLLEVAAPGPVGRAWSWSAEASCPTKSTNFTCNNLLCIRLSMRDSIMDVLQVIYSEIIDMTKVDDIFHLSDGIFSMFGCYYLLEERQGFLDKALEMLKIANKGYLPKLPIIWYTDHLMRESEARPWHKFGVQLVAWQPNPSDPYLSKFKVIQSTRWDLSCEMRKQRCIRYRSWQKMYSWGLWRDIDAFSIEGGEAILWTDLVDTGNLDLHIWPRAAAVAERLWSDIAVNTTVIPSVYTRLDSHRWRMLLKSIKVPPIWPIYCSYNPEKCFRQIKPLQNK